MPHTVEYASSGRAKCRGCNGKIAKGELRFGERQPNSFGEGEMTLWFHVACAAHKRPEPFTELLDSEEAYEITDDDMAVARELRPIAELGIAHRRVPRIDTASLAPTGRARCRCCRELIEKGAWRIGLVYFEEYRFQPAGFIHLTCAGDYFETTDIMSHVRHFNADLEPNQLAELESTIQTA